VNLTQAALATRRSTKSCLCAQYHRVAARRGSQKAVIAVAASILTAIYFILRDGVHYHDLGPDHFNRREAGKTARRLATRLESLGYNVQLQPAAA